MLSTSAGKATAVTRGSRSRLCEKLMALDATAIVPGHGSVQRDWTYAKKLILLLESVRSQVQAAVRQGATLEQTRRRMNLEEFRRQFAGEDPGRRNAFRSYFVHPAVERAYQEAKGSFVEEARCHQGNGAV